MRLGVIDVGSNTVHLLVVDAHHGAAPIPATSHKILLRLSEHVDDDGCIDDAGAADRIVELAKGAFPQARLLVRAYDRAHKLKLVAAGVDVAIRETFAAALQFGEAALRELDVDPGEAARVTAEVRKLEVERFALERMAGFGAGAGMMRTNTGPKPTPLTTPRRQARVLGPDGEPGDDPAGPPAPGA